MAYFGLLSNLCDRDFLFVCFVLFFFIITSAIQNYTEHTSFKNAETMYVYICASPVKKC